MRLKVIKQKWITLLASATLLGSGCLFESDKETKRGTIVDNELRVGFVYLADGTPAKGARVRLFPVDHLPDSGAPAFSDFADEQGKYQVDSLVRGEYNVLSELKGQYSFTDSVFISEQTTTISNDTLGAPGSVAGIVGLQPNHDPITTTVQVMGTNAFANVEGDGHFRLNNLARGTYTLRVLTTLLEYPPLYKTIRVEGGKVDSLKDTLWLPFTGIPVVREIAASYDTLNGIMHLSWKPVAYRNFSEYLIYRDPANAVSLSYLPIGITTDSSYADTLVRSTLNFPYSQSDPSGMRYRYRVRIRSRSDQIGLGYEFAEVSAPPPSAAATTINASVTSVRWDAEKSVDSTEVVAQLESTGRGLAEVTWALGRPDSIIATTTLGGQRQATALLKFGWPKEGIYGVYIKVKDVGGTVWNKTVWVMSNRGPEISLNWPDSIWANSLVSWRPKISDADGDKLRITASGLPKWMTLDTLTGVMTGTPTNSDKGLVSRISITVNDGRRSANLGPVDIFIKPNGWSLKSKMPFGGSMYRSLFAINMGDSILLMQHSNPDYTQHAYYFPSTNKWSNTTYYELPVMSYLSYCQRGNGLIYAFGNTPRERKTQAFIFDPISPKWRLGASTEIQQYNLSGSYTGDKFLMVGQDFEQNKRTLFEYRPTEETWTIKQDSDAISVPTCFWSNGKLYTVFGVDGYRDLPMFIDIYDTTSKVWIKNKKWPEPASKRLFSLVQLNDLVYTIGGYNEWYENGVLKTGKTRVDAFNLELGTSKRVSDRLLPITHSACVESKSKIYCFGGKITTGNGFMDWQDGDQYDVEEYDPALEN